MLRTHIRLLLLTSAAVVALSNVPVAAQTHERAVDVSFGYQLLHIPDETFPFGINADVGVPVSPNVVLVGEAGFNRDSSNPSGTLMFYNFGAGARWIPGPHAGLTPYAQFLLGGVHASASVNAPATSSTLASATAFMFQPGVGVFAPLARKVGVVGQVDYRRAFFSPSAENEFRLVAGVRIGTR